ncbi:hypothetical protein LINGRAHAP2_LOCUS10719, partial [Linum grandiflorum]
SFLSITFCQSLLSLSLILSKLLLLLPHSSSSPISITTITTAAAAPPSPAATPLSSLSFSLFGGGAGKSRRLSRLSLSYGGLGRKTLAEAHLRRGGATTN